MAADGGLVCEIVSGFSDFLTGSKLMSSPSQSLDSCVAEIKYAGPQVSIDLDILSAELFIFIAKLKKIAETLKDERRQKESLQSSNIPEILSVKADPSDSEDVKSETSEPPSKKSKFFHSSPPRTEQGVLDENVQVRADNSEIERRIKAFIERKQMCVDDVNRREFCNILPASQEQEDDSCARTDAVFVPRSDSKSHVKISRVFNDLGPQRQTTAAQSTKTEVPSSAKSASTKHQAHEGIEERLRNMEAHLHLQPGKQGDIFERLKILEERILQLESLSPEYFTPRREDSLALGEIEDKMRSLKQFLLHGKHEVGTP